MSFSFLMCSERSGSNFISKLLNGHENICGPSTKHIINPVARNLFRYGDLLRQENWDILLDDVHRLMSVKFSIWNKEFSRKELENIAPTGDIKALIRNIFLAEAKANGKQHLFIKENHIYEFLPFLMKYFPSSKFVYMTRDPRDMALSWKNNSDHLGGVVNAARQWQKDQQQSLKNYNLLKQFGQAHFVTYENLTKNMEVEIKKITDFLGLPYDENIIDFHKDELTQKNAGMQKAWNNLSQGVIKNNSRKYLLGLTEIEIKMVEKTCYFEMQHLGYQMEFDKSDLDCIKQKDISDFFIKEEKEITYKRSDGVKGNMKAKSIFYQK